MEPESDYQISIFATGEVILLSLAMTTRARNFTPWSASWLSEPDAKWGLITDCLHALQSRSLVRLVAKIEGLEKIWLQIKRVKAVNRYEHILSDSSHVLSFTH